MKFLKAQEKLKEAEAIKVEAAEKSSGTRLKIMQILLLVVVVAGVTFYFTGYRNQPVNQPQTEVAKIPEAPPAGGKAEVAESPVPVVPSPSTQLQPVSQGNSIEQARNATVSIETPWGTGSGFFVNKNYIVTNRHVVRFDQAKLAEFRHQVETGRELIRLEKQKIQEMKEQLQRMPKGPSRSQLAIIIDVRETELKKVLPQYQEDEQRLAKLERKAQPSDIKIILADGSSHEANYLLVSDIHDLALLSLFSGDRSFIARPPAGTGMNQGDKVYAIGSPVGLRHTVTAGIFSGFRSHNGQVYLQTDAAINPGNSGGPLIDESGHARGVTTMILSNTEGIGFAIPIDLVFEEFRSTLF